MAKLPETWQELKERIESAPKNPDLKVTCICGRCDVDVKLTDEDYQNMFNLLAGDWNTMT